MSKRLLITKVIIYSVGVMVGIGMAAWGSDELTRSMGAAQTGLLPWLIWLNVDRYRRSLPSRV